MLPQQFAITEEYWNFIGAFIIVLTITAVPLNTSCKISDYSDYFMRIFTDYTNFRRYFVITLAIGDSLVSV
jgi:hypothetical protein